VVQGPKGGKHVGVATRDKGRGTQNPGSDLKEETLNFTSQFPNMDLKDVSSMANNESFQNVLLLYGQQY